MEPMCCARFTVGLRLSATKEQKAVLIVSMEHVKRRIVRLTSLAVCAAVAMTVQQRADGAQKNDVGVVPAMAADAHPSFEIVTIKPSDPDDTEGGFQVGGHRLFIQNQTVMDMVSFAYAIHRKQIVNGPPWLETQRFDIVGQADVDGYANLRQVQEMLQKLLVSRFNLKFHQEKRELLIYALTLAKSGPKLVQHAGPSNGLPTQSGSGAGSGRRFTNNSISDFALGLQAFLDKPVLDQTGLKGRYDFVVKWTPEGLISDSSTQAPGLFTAAQEQLGLKLTLVKEKANVYAIDRVEEPSEN